MYDILKGYGIPVSMTRFEDINLSPEERVKKIQSFYGKGDDVIVISNHINAGGGTGAEVIYALRNKNTLAKKILKNLENDGLYNRGAYQKKSTTNPNKDYYFIIRDTFDNETLIVEYGFIDNNNDLLKILDNYKEYANSVVDAILDYKNINVEFYTVQKNDTLYSIANKFNTTVDKIKEINNLTGDILQINQKLKIVDNNIYVVKSGDTLYGIAKKYNTTVDKLKDINNLKTNNLKIGDKILIKNNNYYIVQEGDTLYSIAKKNNTTVDNIIKNNNLKSNILQINQKLII